MARYSRCVGLVGEVGETKQSTLCAISRALTNSDCTQPFLDLGGRANVPACFPMRFSTLSAPTRSSRLPLCISECDHARVCVVVACLCARCATDRPWVVASTAGAPVTRPPAVDLRPRSRPGLRLLLLASGPLQCG